MFNPCSQLSSLFFLQVPVVMRGNRGKGREGKRHSKRSSADAKLQLVEDEVTPDT